MKRWQETGILILVGLLSAACIGLSDAPAEVETVVRPFVSPPKHSEYFTFGYNENFSDSLWIRLIQDIDFCDVIATDKQFVESPKSAVKKPFFCHSRLGWSYQMLDTITTLTPKFRMPYNHGATVLSVTVGDAEGAKRIFDRGIENFPTEWSLQFRAAYHYLYELHDEKRAAELLVMAGKNGAPAWVYALAARLYTKEGQALLAKSVLESVLEQDPDSKYAERLKLRLRQLDDIIAGKAPADEYSGH